MTRDDVDAMYMMIYKGASVEDMERGAAYCDHLIATSSLVYTHPAKRELWRHHADLLRAEIEHRKVMG